RTVEHDAGPRTSQGAGLVRRTQARRWSETSVLFEPLANFVQIDHHCGVLLRRPGHNFGFHVIGPYGVKHRSPASFAAISTRWTFGPRKVRQSESQKRGGTAPAAPQPFQLAGPEL